MPANDGTQVVAPTQPSEGKHEGGDSAGAQATAKLEERVRTLEDTIRHAKYIVTAITITVTAVTGIAIARVPVAMEERAESLAKDSLSKAMEGGMDAKIRSVAEGEARKVASGLLKDSETAIASSMDRTLDRKIRLVSGRNGSCELVNDIQICWGSIGPLNPHDQSDWRTRRFDGRFGFEFNGEPHVGVSVYARSSGQAYAVYDLSVDGRGFAGGLTRVREVSIPEKDETYPVFVTYVAIGVPKSRVARSD